METKYPSKRDLWLRLLIVASALVSLASGVGVWMQPGDLTTRVLVSGLCAITSLFIVDLLIRTSYTLTSESLIVRCGLMHWRVPYSAMTSVRPSHTLISGPALSLDRLVIKRNDSLFPVIISPIDQDRFLQDLADRDEELYLEDGSVTRSDI